MKRRDSQNGRGEGKGRARVKEEIKLRSLDRS